MRAFGALALGVVLAAVATPATAARDTSGAPGTFTSGVLPSGGRYVVRQTTDVPVAAVELWYRAPAVGFEKTAIPGLSQLAAESVAASTPFTGLPLGQLVEQLGGRLTVNAYPDSIAVSAVVPAVKAASVLRAMTAAFFSPVLTDAGLEIAKRDVAEDSVLRRVSSEDVVRDSLVGALFSSGPAHYPMLGEPASLRNVAIDQARSFATRAFRAQNAVLVVTGAVGPAIVASAVTGRPAGTTPETAPSPEPNAASAVAASPGPVTTEGIEDGFGLGWIGPPISDESDATALDFIADYLFRPDSGVIPTRLANTGVTVVGQFVTYHDPGVMLVSLTGEKASSQRSMVEQELLSLAKPLDAKRFTAARDAFVYHILSDLQTPSQIADTFGWYTVEGAPEYTPGANGLRGKYLALATSLSPASVAAAARRYLSKAPVLVTLTEKKPAS